MPRLDPTISLLVCAADEPGFPILYASPSFERLTGYAADEVLGRSCTFLQGPDSDPAAIADMARALREGRECRVVLVNYRKDGSSFLNEVFLSPLPGEDGRATRYVGVQHDVTDRHEQADELLRLAHHDALTGLPNRRLLEDRLALSLLRAARDGHPTAMLMLDVDQFKRVNDTLGHGAGDALLRQVAGRLADTLRGSDTVARMGGDEFALLYEQGASEETIDAIAERVRSVFAAPFELGERSVPVTASIGAALSRSGETAPETLLREADVAMYRAKRRGPGLVEVFDRATWAEAVGLLDLEVELHRALEEDGLHLEYQPKVGLRTGEVAYAEALIRWDHPRHGRISPVEFIPMAETTALIKRVGDLVLETACRDAARWRAEGRAPIGFCVNLSAPELVREDLVALVRAALSRHALEPASIGFEWTETAALTDHRRAVENLRHLRALGCHLAIDDFGTGYASLSHLRDFPADELKLDRSFVSSAGQAADGHGTTLRTAILALAAGFSLTSTAEGIETAVQLNDLLSLACDQGQGFLLSRPVRIGLLPDAVADAAAALGAARESS